MEGMQFEYEIDGRKFIQRRLALGQVRQLSEVTSKCPIPGVFNGFTIFNAFGKSISEILAIVLIPKDKPLETAQDIKKAIMGKDMRRLIKEFDFAIETDMVELFLQVFEDFLECNRTSSKVDKIRKMLGVTEEQVEEAKSAVQETVNG